MGDIPIDVAELMLTAAVLRRDCDIERAAC